MSAPEPVRIAMWSGPRNISTAMMRSFENRDDTAVSDEPFYAAYLAASGIDHPMREESLASQPQDPRVVAEQLLGPVPGGAPIWYQKHMTHHMLPGFGLDWAAVVPQCLSHPRSGLCARLLCAEAARCGGGGSRFRTAIASCSSARPSVSAMLRRWSNPPMCSPIRAARSPRSATALDIPFSQKMLAWPAGSRATDGAWAPVWYASVEASTGFAGARRCAAAGAAGRI